MEYVRGGTLAHLLDKHDGFLPFAQALPLIKEIAAALDYAHSRKPPVIHRDLKPLNILITADGHAKIADYGLAHALKDSATRISMSQTAGTLAYMAPEQIRGKGIGPWTDNYAFACLVCEMLSGEPPFPTGDLRWQIIHEEPELSPDLPETVQKALLCGLAKDPGQRPASACALVEMLTGERLPEAGGVGPESTKNIKSKAQNFNCRILIGDNFNWGQPPINRIFLRRSSKTPSTLLRPASRGDRLPVISLVNVMI